MVPASFTGYFAAGTSAAAALVGLLFVAISMRPETIFGDDSRAEGRALAGSTFTSLVNAFFICFMALIPESNLGIPAAILAAISILNTLRLHRHLRRHESHLVLLALSLFSFGGELVVSVLLALSPHDQGYLFDLVYLVIASFAVGLSRAWQLLSGQHIHPQAPKSEAGTPTAPAS